MWSDNETSEDLLGFKVHADLLIDVLEDETVLPVTIGVFGDWGSGKSSILKMVHEHLIGDDEDLLKNDTLVLYFNGWLFEGYDDAKAALLESIIEKFEKHKKLKHLIVDETRKLLKSVKWMRALGLGFKRIVLPTAAAYLTGGTSLIPFLANQLSNLNTDQLKDNLTGEKAESFLNEIINKEQVDEETTLVREFRKDFSQMIEKSKIKKLVVIIDDLDRCTPDRIIENLEAIKLFLNVDKTAFIIGADPRIVRHAIEYRYQTAKISSKNDQNNKNDRIVSDYLEKLIQIPYTLPALSDNEVETYMTLLYCKRELGTSYPNVLTTFHDFRKKNRYGVFGYADIESIIEETEKKKLGSSISLIASLSSIIAQGLNGNPRQIKRFLNSFTLRHRLATIASLSEFRIDILAKLMVLEYTFADLFKELYFWQDTQNGEPREITELELIAETNTIDKVKDKFNGYWQDPKAVKWLKLDPKFSNVDLRDYFWISRDQIFSSMSGSSLIPPHIRSLFKTLIEYKSDTILKNLITKEVSTLTGPQLIHLHMLLEKELLKNAAKSELHKIYIELIRQKITNSISQYKKVISQIGDHDVIPFSLRNDLEFAAKDNQEITQLYSVFNESSKIYKGLKAKK